MILPTIADLKNVPGFTTDNYAKVLGYYEPGDGGGGDFWWDDNSTDDDNGGTIFQVVNTFTGRWNRIVSGTIDVECFGAKGDGVSNDTAAIQSLINYCLNNIIGEIRFSKKNYILGSALSITGNFGRGLKLIGDKTRLNASFAGVLLTIGDRSDPSPEYRSYVLLDGFTLYGYGSTTAGNVSLKINEVANVYIKDCVLRNSYYGLWIYGGLISRFTNLTIRNNAVGLKAEPSNYFAPNNNIFMACNLLTNTAAIDWDSGNGNIFIGCEIEGNNASGSVGDSVISSNFTNAGNITFNSCWLEGDIGSYGIKYVARAAYSSMTLINCEVIHACTYIIEVDGNSAGYGTLNIIGGRVANSLTTYGVNIGSNFASVVCSNAIIPSFGGNTAIVASENNGTFCVGVKMSIAAFNSYSPPNNQLTNGRGDTILHVFTAADGTRNGYIAGTTAGGIVFNVDKLLPISFRTNAQQRWSIDAANGHLVPYDAVKNIGTSSLPVANIYASKLTLPNGAITAVTAASADTSTTPSASYTQSEIQAILTELRDLKTKMRLAGLLAS